MGLLKDIIGKQMKTKKEGETIPEENEDIPDLVADTNFEEVSKKVD